MSKERSSAILEIVFALGLVVVVAAVFWNSLSLPKSLREPLGSSTVPQIVCVIIALFCIVLIVRSVRVLVTSGTEPSTKRPEAVAVQPHTPRPALAVAVFGLAVVYVALLQTRSIPTSVLTPALLGASILLLNGFRRAAILPTAVVALAVGITVPLIFSGFFQVNLP